MPGDPTQGQLSYSNISTWIACHMRYHLVYERKIRPRVYRRPPELGSAVHAGMAAGILHRSDPRDAAADGVISYIKKFIEDRGGKDAFFEEELDMMQSDILPTAIVISQRTLSHMDLPRWETISVNGKPGVEVTLSCPLPGWGEFVGTIDWVARDLSTGRTLLIDHKVRKQFLPNDSEEVNLQMAAYQYLLMRAGKVITAGSMSNQIKAEPPKTPTINKDGKSMSRARIATDWPTYRQALLNVRLNPDDYLEMIDKLDVEFWRYSLAYRSVSEIQNIWKGVIQHAAWDIARKHKHIYRTMSHMTCMNCGVRGFCLADLRGHDTEYLLQTAYMVGSDGEYTETEVEVAE